MDDTARRWVVGGAIAVLALVAAGSTALALQHVSSQVPEDDVAPVPAFTDEPDAPTATPTPPPTETAVAPAGFDRSEERFLAADGVAFWRGVAGECGAVDPLLERSTDGGATWTDVTPLYLDVGQLMGASSFADGQAEILAAVGADCEVQALRTFTQGQFWAPYDDVSANTQYIAPDDAASIVLPNGAVSAPCSDARGLRANSALTVLTCEGSAFVRGGDGSWSALPARDVAAITLDDADILVAHAADTCVGLALTRYVGADSASPENAGCLAEADASAPTTIAVENGLIFAWSGDAWSTATP